MKQIRQWCILWVGLSFICGCGVFEESNATVSTDKVIYAVPNTLNYTTNNTLTIKASFRNTTGHVLYINKCINAPDPILQHFENGMWVTIELNRGELLCLEYPPIVILWNAIYEQDFYFENNLLIQLIKQGRIHPNQENSAYRLVFDFVAKPSVLNPKREETHATDAFYLVLDK